MTTEHQTSLLYLPSLVEELAASPELDLVKIVVGRFVARQHTFYLASGIRPRGDRGVAPPSFNITTLLQTLAWERLDQPDIAGLSHDGFRSLLDEILASAHARALGIELLDALGWGKELDTQPAHPELLKQLVWSALILEVDPPATHKPFHIANYDLTAPENWGLSYDQLRAKIVNFRPQNSQSVNGLYSRDMARLVLCILEPLMPDFAIRDVPHDLLYGTHRWTSFAHGVALADVLQPGGSSRLTFEQLTGLALEQSGDADKDAMQIIAATRVAPAIRWALAHGVLVHRQNADYSEAEAQLAVSRLDEYSAELSRSMLALFSDPPNRIEMARKTFKELMSPYIYMDELIMSPTTFWKRIEYSLRNPSPRIRPGEFYLLDVFTAGYMQNGIDQFRPLRTLDPHMLQTVEKLKGIDMPALFDVAFKTYFDEARTAYEFFLGHLLQEIPAEDRVSLSEGKTTVYVLQRETYQDRSAHTARFGFLIQCEHNRRQFTYEVFPFESRLTLHADLADLTGKPLNLDWVAYTHDKEARNKPAPNVIPVALGVFPAVSPSDIPAVNTLSSPRFTDIARLVAQQHMFYDYPQAYSHYRGKTGIEFVSNNYPPVLRISEFLVPGLSCYNALQTNESPALTCLLDVGSIMGLPMLRLAGGAFRITAQAGKIGLLKTLPAFRGAAGMFIKSAGRNYLDALSPLALGSFLASVYNGVTKTGKFSGIALTRMATRMNTWAKLKNSKVFFRMPQRVNGKIGYPMSGRGAVSSSAGPSASDTKIKNVAEYDDFLARHNTIKDPQLKVDVRRDVLEGADIHTHVRPDGSRTLIRKDSADNIFIDLATNKTVQLKSHYDYRTLKSWAVADEAANPYLTRVKANTITSGRADLEPPRVASAREAIENGAYLAPLKVQKTATGYSVIDGNHRLQAARDLNLEKVPVVVHDASGKPLISPLQTTPRILPVVGGSHAVSTDLDTQITTILPRRQSI